MLILLSLHSKRNRFGKMKSMMLTGIGKMEMNERTVPVIKAKTEVLIRISHVGVCGSDIHYYKTGRIGDQVVSYPFTVGHECAGTVVEVGKEVKRLQPGDRVAIDPAMPCWTCDQCLSGRTHTCLNLRFLGSPGQADGCLSEFIVMPESSCYPLPSSVSLEEAVLSEPLSIGMWAVKRAPSLHQARIGILGFGPIGMSVFLVAQQLGCRSVYVTDKINARLKMAKECGASWTGNPLTTDIVYQIHPDSLDIVFECCGQQDAIDQAITLLRPGGHLMIVGIPETDRLSFAAHHARRREITLSHVRRQSDCVEEVLELIAEGRVEVQQMITHRFPFSRTAEAFDLVMEYRDGVMKALIMMEE